MEIKEILIFVFSKEKCNFVKKYIYLYKIGCISAKNK